MWHRCIISQLINAQAKHVSSATMKLVCVSCLQHLRRDFSCSSRRISPRDRDNETLMKSNAQILWDYLRIDSPPKKSQLMLVLGNSDLRTADHAAKLYREGFAPLVVVSGKEGHGTKGKWRKPEAVVFAERLVKNNVPAERILIEPKATNTGENIRFTQMLLRDRLDTLQPQSIILVQTPFMGRRSLATFLKQWDEAECVDICVTSPPIPMEEYPDKAAGYNSLSDVIVEMVRNMQRVQQYPSKGFQVPQYPPPHVLEAFDHLESHFMLKDSQTRSN
ncbi:uncharacterized protein SCO4629-like [Littorina saxatilis]|uniref:DUF218 domain-containing protein n=1 Tax=Littorina saxatilis TaxID=31220 RepID=A0AAN9BZ22_9CAEN